MWGQFREILNTLEYETIFISLMRVSQNCVARYSDFTRFFHSAFKFPLLILVQHTFPCLDEQTRVSVRPLFNALSWLQINRSLWTANTYSFACERIKCKCKQTQKCSKHHQTLPVSWFILLQMLRIPQLIKKPLASFHKQRFWHHEAFMGNDN